MKQYMATVRTISIIILFFIISLASAQESNIWRATTATIRAVVEISGDTGNVIGVTPDEIKHTLNSIIESKGFRVEESSHNTLIVSMIANYHQKPNSGAAIKITITGTCGKNDGLSIADNIDQFDVNGKQKIILMEQDKYTTSQAIASITTASTSVVNLVKQEMISHRAHLDKRKRYFPSRVNTEEPDEGRINKYDW